MASQASQAASTTTGLRSTGLNTPAGTFLPPGCRCRYKSEQFGWLSAQILRLHQSDGTYDLDVRQRASAEKIAPVSETGLAALSLAWPRGSLVCYRSRSREAWLPAVVSSFNTADGTYNLDVCEHAHPDRIRARSMFANQQCQPKSAAQSLTGHPSRQSQALSGKHPYASTTTCPPPPVPIMPLPSILATTMGSLQTTGMNTYPNLSMTMPTPEEDRTPSIRAIHCAPRENEMLVAVVVSICSGSSYDPLFSQVPQLAGEGQRVATYAVSESSLPFIAGAFNGQTLPGRLPTDVHRSLRHILADISSVQPDSVVFNWECCSGCCGEHFHSRAIVMSLVKRLLDRGHMVMFSDFSLKALIREWSQDHLGPNPFVKTAVVNNAFMLGFDPAILRACSSAQLQKLGELAEDGKASLHAMPDTIVFSVNWQEADCSSYKCEVLTAMTELDGQIAQPGPGLSCEVGRHSGSAGHVLLTYPSGGQLLASAGHWVELSRLDVTEAHLMEVAASFGAAFQGQVQASMSACNSKAERKQAVQTLSSQMVQQSPPCSLAPRPYPKSAPAAML